MLRHVGKVAAGTVPAVVLARLSLPALGVLVFLAVLATGVTCWLLSTDARAARLSQVLLAWRGNPRCLPADSPAIPALPALPPQSRRRLWPHRP